MKKVSPVSGFASDVEWGCTISNIQVTGDGSLKVGGGAPRIEEADSRCKYTGYWEDYKYGADGLAVAVVEHRPRQAHRAQRARATSGKCRSATRRRSSTICISGTFLNTDCGKVAVTLDGDAADHPSICI